MRAKFNPECSVFQLGCCGVNNYTDWGKKRPDSCCESSCNNGSAPYQTVNTAVKVASFLIAPPNAPLPAGLFESIRESV